MLTRLRVSGFKNLVDVDLYFGPFTCIAGANGVGKSNLFDAIRFLSALADRPFIEAARAVRDEEGRLSDIRSLFHRIGDSYADEMSFEAEMLVPQSGIDDLGQRAEARSTFLRYAVTLGYRADTDPGLAGPLVLLKEELVPIKRGDVPKHILFPASLAWRQSAIKGRRSGPGFISTEGEGASLIIKQHQDGTQGRALARAASALPRTVLSVANAAESPTALLARREMQSWRLIQLEPSSLRRPDEFAAPTQLGVDGSHLAATLYRLARTKNNLVPDVYSQIAQRLAELIEDVKSVSIDRDERRELLTLMVTDGTRTPYPARALSDGTLRFLALAVLELETDVPGLLCFEEPENGIHPERIPAILRLLRDIAVDTEEPVGPDNPLRQVLINTHAPSVVSRVSAADLVIADTRESIKDRAIFNRAIFTSLPNTWRQEAENAPHPIARGALLAYLNPVLRYDMAPDPVIDRQDLQVLVPRRPRAAK